MPLREKVQEELVPGDLLLAATLAEDDRVTMAADVVG
jgi:hypothetical protein